MLWIILFAVYVPAGLLSWLLIRWFRRSASWPAFAVKWTLVPLGVYGYVFYQVHKLSDPSHQPAAVIGFLAAFLVWFAQGLTGPASPPLRRSAAR